MDYITLIRTTVAAIKSVEQLMPTSTGKQKFDTAIALIEEVMGDISPLIPALTGIVTLLVNTFRKTGVLPTPPVV